MNRLIRMDPRRSHYWALIDRMLRGWTWFSGVSCRTERPRRSSRTWCGLAKPWNRHVRRHATSCARHSMNPRPWRNSWRRCIRNHDGSRSALAPTALRRDRLRLAVSSLLVRRPRGGRPGRSSPEGRAKSGWVFGTISATGSSEQPSCHDRKPDLSGTWVTARYRVSSSRGPRTVRRQRHPAVQPARSAEHPLRSAAC